MRPCYQLSIYQKKYKKPAAGTGIEELNLTSLLDVLIILLFFLLMSYNPSVLEVNTGVDTNPPFSESLELGTDAVMFQVNAKQELTLGKEFLGNVQNDEHKERIEAAFKRAFEAQKAKFIKKQGPQTEAYKNVNFILDGSLVYGQMEQLMLVASIAGFDNYKFVVRSRPRE